MKRLLITAASLAVLTTGAIAGENINNLPDVKIVSSHDCGINLHINFKTNSYEIKPSSLPRIKKFAEYLKSHPNLKAVIVGYTDSRGSKEYNQKLSENRAKAVYQKLIEYGVAASRLSYKGMGEENPVASNATKEGRALNRRIEAVLEGNS